VVAGRTGRPEGARRVLRGHRADQGLQRLIEAIRETGHWDDTLFILLSDNGPPFPGAKTTLYEPGMHLPLIVRDPRQTEQGRTCDARVCWADITPTILDYCGVEPKPSPPVVPAGFEGRPQAAGKPQPYRFHGRSFLAALGREHPEGFDEIYASHTFHEITMYYPMRAVISGRYKYILNLAHELPYPFASDLYDSLTWQTVLQRKLSFYGRRAVENYIHRPRHEIYDLEADPDEIRNLADDPSHQKTLEALKAKVKNFQERTKDPWILKWEYE
jgi:N-sulfoglucosamine sulfohydrolase